MSLSVFDLFSIGIGPSSSHTVGPMIAAHDFVNQLKTPEKITRIQVDVYGSLALTGVGHGTDRAIINGLEGKHPETVQATSIMPRFEEICNNKKLCLAGQHEINFCFEKDYQEHPKIFLDKHSNGLKISAYQQDDCISTETYYSIGGGFIVTDAQFGQETTEEHPIPYPFNSAEELLLICKQQHMSISEIMLANETAMRDKTEVLSGIEKIAEVMNQCIDNGLKTHGILPGGLNVKRRAGELYEKLQQANTKTHSIHETSDIMNWLNAFAMAVNEENAAGHTIVTAPTNGAAGVMPAVMRYYQTLVPEAEQHISDFFLSAAAVGILCKKNASISGAEVGCQGEVGSAAAMAAAGLTAALGGTPEQVENAAEIALEHHLGMTCDPVKGLVQIPCIERNAMGAVKAVNASRMALVGDGQHKVPLDKVIKTMMETGRDMMTIYKETSLGGLAVNVPEC